MSTLSLTPSSPCPCGRLDARRRPLAWPDCCGRYLDAFDTQPAPDAESLMRSRYSAYVLGRADYLRATWHASTRPPELALDPGAEWLGLTVRGHWPAGVRAEVEFLARYRQEGRVQRLQERSRFVCETVRQTLAGPDEDAPEQARWFYVDGDFKSR
ncbi:YchJ family metal-binding protein [Curvibacter sp. RS43]|uniref:YchJ family protein n=1 Tax=Curvibacter microcysteis TaxID=3026419 RepID=UPI0023606205|nr:YchJ family metal-binding protein [Curvibacter sp. RS43]MDD0810241.1 YchJ family metal-binding protein [Curvibacter sp. RS43]